MVGFTVSVRNEDRQEAVWSHSSLASEIRFPVTEKARSETRFACNRDRFACGNFERNWYTMVSLPEHGGADMIDAPEDS